MLSSEFRGSPASVAHSSMIFEPSFDVGEYVVLRGKVFSRLGAAKIVSYTPTLSNPYEVRPCAIKVCNKIVSSKVQLGERTFMCSEADIMKATDYKKSMKAAAAIKIQAIVRGHACKDYIAKMKRVAARRPISHAEHLAQLVASHNQGPCCHYCGHNASSLAALQQHMHEMHRDPEWGTPSAHNNGSAFQVYYNPPQQASAQVSAASAPAPAIATPVTPAAPAAPAASRKRKRKFGGIKLGISPMWFQKRLRVATQVSTFSTLQGQNNLVYKSSDSVAREKAMAGGKPYQDVYYEDQ